MELLDLPLDVLEIIVEILVTTTTMRGGFRLREVNSCFADLIERDYMKRPAFMARRRPKPLLHGRHRLSEADVFSKIRSGLLAPRLEWSGDLCMYLRKSVAVLMNTREFRLTDADGDGAIGSDGYLEDHVDMGSQARLLKIIDSITAAFVCFAGVAEAAQVLLDFDEEPHAWFIRKCLNPLQWAIATAVFMEKFTIVRALLSLYVPVDLYEDPENESARYPLAGVFSLAVKKCSCEMVSLLLQHGANVNQEVYRGEWDTPLRDACQRGSLAMVELILNPRWGLNEGNDHDRTDRYNYYNWDKSDLKRQIHVLNNLACWNYRLAIQYAARCGCCHYGKQECDERMMIINLLTNRKSFANMQEIRLSVLTEACTWGCMKITCMILDAGACPNVIGLQKQSALAYAASHGHVELMEYLLERGAPYLSIFFPPNSVRFVEEAANADMMMYHYDRDATIMEWGPLQHTKADFILKTATEKNCVRVVKLLMRAGFDLRKDDRGARAPQSAFSNDVVGINDVPKDYRR